MTLDGEKALDCMHRGYLEAVLKKFGFIGPILSAVLALYTYPSGKVFTSGALSSEFVITNGTGQGCPLSPLIFALLMEPLAHTIRTAPKVTGTHIGPTEKKN